ncbi:MAG: hypothetical protein WDN50_13980 [Bradyrhizobium sp.]
MSPALAVVTLAVDPGVVATTVPGTRSGAGVSLIVTGPDTTASLSV